MNERSRVFVLEPTEYSLTKAKRFGDLVFLFGDSSLRPHPCDEQFSDEVLRVLKHHEYDPDRDYVAVSGNMVAVTLLVALLSANYFETNLLLFDHRPGVRDFRCVNLIQAGTRTPAPQWHPMS